MKWNQAKCDITFGKNHDAGGWWWKDNDLNLGNLKVKNKEKKHFYCE